MVETIDRIVERVGASEQPNGLETLTDRELEVLALMAIGDSNQAIADKLFLELRTVYSHTSKIYSKLELTEEDNPKEGIPRVKAVKMYGKVFQYEYFKREVDAALSPREHEVLSRIAQGYSNLGIAEELFIAKSTVENRITEIYEKLGLDYRDRNYVARVTAMLMFPRVPVPESYQPKVDASPIVVK